MNSRSVIAVGLIVAAAFASATVSAQPFRSPRIWERATEYSFSWAPNRTVHDGSGGMFAYFQLLDWANGQQVGSPIKLRAGDGSLDSDFAPEIIEYSATAVAVQADGKVVIAGSRERSCYVARLLPTGELDPGFHPFEFTQTVRHLNILADGGVLVTIYGNTFLNPSPLAYPTPNPTLLKLRPDGRLDANFQIQELTTGALTPPLVDAAGRIHYAGANGSLLELFRLLPDGRKDPAFFVSGSLPFDLGGSIRGLGQQRDGKLLLVGSLRFPYTLPANVPFEDRWTNSFAAIRLEADGRFDPTFKMIPRRSLELDDFPRMLVMQGDKFVVAAGGLHRFNADGSLDESFNRYRPPGYFNFWVSQSEAGHLYIAGDSERGLLAFDRDGLPAPEFALQGFGTTEIPRSFAFLGETNVLLTGAFNRVDQVSQLLATLLSRETGQMAGVQPELTDVLGPGIISPTVDDIEKVRAFEAPEAGAYLAGDASRLDETGNPVTQRFAVRLNAEGRRDPSFQVSADLLRENPRFIGDTARQLWFYLSGAEAALAWWSRQQTPTSNPGWGLLGRLGPDGRVDRAFEATPPASVRKLFDSLGRVTYEGGTLWQIVAGVFQPLSARPGGGLLVSVVTTNGSQRLVKLSAEGQPDPAFVAPEVAGAQSYVDYPEVTDPLSGLKTQPLDGVLTFFSSVYQQAVELPDGSVLVLGEFSELGGVPATGLARLSPQGTVERAPLPNFRLRGSPFRGDEVRLLAVAADSAGRCYVAGLFDEVDGQPAQGIVRLNADGSWDRTFVSPVELVDYPSASATLRVDGAVLWAMGTFRSQGETFPRPLWKIDLATADSLPALQWQVAPDGQFTLSWPATAAGLALEVASAVTGEGNWRPAALTVTQRDGVNTVVVPMPSQTEFFRLRRVAEQSQAIVPVAVETLRSRTGGEE